MWDQVSQYFLPWSLGILVSLALLWICLQRPRLGQRLFGYLFLLGGIVQVYLAWIYPRDYLVFGQFTFFSIYRRFIYMILFRQAIWMGGLLVVLHFYLAYMFWTLNQPKKIAYLVALIWLTLLAPLGFGSAFPATVILGIALYTLWVNRQNRTEGL